MTNPLRKLPFNKFESVISRVFDAPRELVFQAWTDPRQLAKWWGPRGFTNPVCELDPRPGGLIRIDMRGPNGVIYRMAGVYLEIVEPERLIFTSGALDPAGHYIFELINTVSFIEANGRTTLTEHARIIRSTPAAAPYLAGRKAGFSQSLERLAEYIVTKESPLVLARAFGCG